MSEYELSQKVILAPGAGGCDGVEAIITAVCYRSGGVTYEVSYFANDAHEEFWCSAVELDFYTRTNNETIRPR